ncbi:hypothetical protein EXIGLDRAFT_765168 [Exidia glandulosa HHB12029]|uniref:F-box domain-containing protein n=1 Tax=Exidia glandulosa HHB12029 TaxID=1314781 RepID=A0A165KP96_EXIGL|nr:hypothetical protein EXIGLDRAFT_765168 [Exidia glandulosa HHB12029]
MRTIGDIPAEVIKHAFAHLDIYDLLRAAAVSQRWRDLGIEHPAFWKYIVVTSATAGAFEILELRLGQGRGRPFLITVDISDMHPLIVPRLLRRLLPATMYCVQQLHITLDANYLLDLWAVLNMRAPELVEFCLTLLSPDRQLPRIPLMPWIFGNSSDKLCTVSICDVLLPNETIPAFANVQYLQLDYAANTTLEFPCDVLEMYPSIGYLTLGAGVIAFSEPFSPAALAGVSRLTKLDINVSPPATTTFVRCMPRLSQIPVAVLTGYVDFDSMYDFLEPLRSPFHFALMRTGTSRFWIMVRDLGTGYVRLVSDDLATYHRDAAGIEETNVLFENEDFAPQIEAITLSM